MKIGDKLCCIKTLYHFNTTFFIENKYYEIVSLLDSDIQIKDERGWSSEFNISEYSTDDYNFKDYFKTPTQIRKSKLKKLYQNEYTR
jgi:hypothetical protein